MIDKSRKRFHEFDLDNSSHSGPTGPQWLAFGIVSFVAVSAVLLNVVLIIVWSPEGSHLERGASVNPDESSESEMNDELLSLRERLRELDGRLANANMEIEVQRNRTKEAERSEISLPHASIEEVLRRIDALTISIEIGEEALDVGLDEKILRTYIREVGNNVGLTLREEADTMLYVSIGVLPKNEFGIGVLVIRLSLIERVRVPRSSQSWLAEIYHLENQRYYRINSLSTSTEQVIKALVERMAKKLKDSKSK